MQIANYLANIGSVKIPRLHTGSDKTVEEFYRNCIEPNLPRVDVVAAWNKLLMRYVQDPDAIFFLRRYASASKKDWYAIRRGFLTKYQDGSGYVFCDNFFAHYFYVMAYDGFVPGYDDFKSSILNRKLPYGSARTKEEEPLQAYPRGKATKINSSGWKLAHLFSVNGDDYSLDYRQVIKNCFPRGNRDEWQLASEGYAYRAIPRKMDNQERAILQAHFLRLVDPMNYFLVPMKKYESDGCGGNIGEFQPLLEYVFCRFSKLYGAEFRAYRKAILDGSRYAMASDNCHGDYRIDISYGCSLKEKVCSDSSKQYEISREKSSRKTDISPKQLHEMARLYLEDNLSFRSLERQVLKIDSQDRGGGFIAKRALNDFGITNANKGALKCRSLQAEYEQATGQYKKALKVIYGDIER